MSFGHGGPLVGGGGESILAEKGPGPGDATPIRGGEAAAGNVGQVSTLDVTAPEPTVLARAERGVGHLTLNRPRAINALDLDMILQLSAALDAWEHDPDWNDDEAGSGESSS